MIWCQVVKISTLSCGAQKLGGRTTGKEEKGEKGEKGEKLTKIVKVKKAVVAHVLDFCFLYE